MAPPWTLPLLEYPGWAQAPPGGAGGAGGGDGTPGSPLSMQQVEALFADLAAQPHIPFAYALDGCFARAHEMRRIMLERGIDSRKAWNYGSLSVPNTPVGDVQWRYHVAPLVSVRGADGVVRDMVIDPSMFDGPVTAEEWRAAQNDPSSVLESSEGGIFYRDQGAAEGVGERDDDYSSTKETLEQYTEQLEIIRGGRP